MKRYYYNSVANKGAKNYVNDDQNSKADNQVSDQNKDNNQTIDSQQKLDDENQEKIEIANSSQNISTEQQQQEEKNNEEIAQNNLETNIKENIDMNEITSQKANIGSDFDSSLQQNDIKSSNEANDEQAKTLKEFESNNANKVEDQNMVQQNINQSREELKNFKNCENKEQNIIDENDNQQTFKKQQTNFDNSELQSKEQENQKHIRENDNQIQIECVSQQNPHVSQQNQVEQVHSKENNMVAEEFNNENDEKVNKAGQEQKTQNIIENNNEQNSMIHIPQENQTIIQTQLVQEAISPKQDEAQVQDLKNSKENQLDEDKIVIHEQSAQLSKSQIPSTQFQDQSNPIQTIHHSNNAQSQKGSIESEAIKSTENENIQLNPKVNQKQEDSILQSSANVRNESNNSNNPHEGKSLESQMQLPQNSTKQQPPIPGNQQYNTAANNIESEKPNPTTSQENKSIDISNSLKNLPNSSKQQPENAVQQIESQHQTDWTNELLQSARANFAESFERFLLKTKSDQEITKVQNSETQTNVILDDCVPDEISLQVRRRYLKERMDFANNLEKNVEYPVVSKLKRQCTQTGNAEKLQKPISFPKVKLQKSKSVPIKSQKALKRVEEFCTINTARFGYEKRIKIVANRILELFRADESSLGKHVDVLGRGDIDRLLQELMVSGGKK